jgi:hypothetical protein
MDKKSGCRRVARVPTLTGTWFTATFLPVAYPNLASFSPAVGPEARRTDVEPSVGTPRPHSLAKTNVHSLVE